MSPAIKVTEPNLDISFQGKLPEPPVENMMIDDDRLPDSLQVGL